MTFVKFSARFSLISLAFIASMPVASAQDAGYAPPPMFDDMTPPMVRPAVRDGNIVEPKSSARPAMPDTMNAPAKPPVVLPRVSVDPNAQPAPGITTRPMPAQTQTQAVPTPPAPQTKSAPVNPVPPAAPSIPATPAPPPQPQQPSATVTRPKMMQPIIEPKDLKREKPAAAPKVAPVETPKLAVPPAPPKKPVDPAPSNDDAPAPIQTKVVKDAVKSSEDDRTAGPKIQPVKRDPKVSAIRGPKEMPAIPQETIEHEKIFEAPVSESEPTMLERQQSTGREKPFMPIVPRPRTDVEAATFDEGEQGVLKKTYVYEPGQIALPAPETDALAAAVVKKLDDEENADWRVQIKSFATPHGTGVSSDRRIALSRALSLRSSLITQGVKPGRIDVITEAAGATETGKAPDRIDLYLYGPKEE